MIVSLQQRYLLSELTLALNDTIAAFSRAWCFEEFIIREIGIHKDFERKEDYIKTMMNDYAFYLKMLDRLTKLLAKRIKAGRSIYIEVDRDDYMLTYRVYSGHPKGEIV